MMYALKLIEVPEGTPTTLIGKVLKLKSLPATVGRGQDASLVIQHRKLSRLHCRFYLADDSLHVRDLGSTNGTAVNGVLAMGAHPLRVGDQVSLGGVVFQVGQWLDPAHAKSSDPAVLAEATAPTQPNFAEETIDWRPDSPVADTSRLAPVPASCEQDEDKAAIPASGGSTGTGSTGTRPTGTGSTPTPAMISPSPEDSAVRLEGLPTVDPVSHVHIDSSFVAKAGTADPSRLPQLRPSQATEVDPDALDLAEIAESKKDASVTALGNFFSQRNLKRP
jgi:predicted component of type VI protein secretion system